ncbi:MAG: hypothetical protein FWF75_01820 [Propionibacteriaceae bacterium]|nr:hypothetical protein [Propionibacteriaceae bacterium]
MNVVRTAGRACFAAFFVVDGLRMADRSEQDLAGVQAVMDRVLPTVRRLAPTWVSDRLPDDAVTWSKAIGSAQAAAGACYGANVLARPAAAVLALASVPQVLAGLTCKDPHQRRDIMLHGLALLGAALVATQEPSRRRSLMGAAFRGIAAVDVLEARAVRRVGSAAASGIRSARARRGQADPADLCAIAES